MAHTFLDAPVEGLALVMMEGIGALAERETGHTVADVTRTVSKTLVVVGQDGSKDECPRDRSALLFIYGSRLPCEHARRPPA